MIAENWEAVIGMEVHVQLSTASKMFCACSTDYLGAPPNSNVCPVCLGMPGVLPVANRVAVEKVLKTALALNCEIPEKSKFDRKNYFYPDLPKGYQISQYDLPLSRSGWIDIGRRRVRITRAHLEEDTGSLKHAGDALHAAQESLVDFNRSGMPLMEIVTEPDLRDADEATAFATRLRDLLRWIGASDGDMERGQLRIEPNISLRRPGEARLGTKTELKNLNSFRALQRGIEFEIVRQRRLLETGKQVLQETRGWSEAEQRTFSQRTKEYAQDYRYFPEPDLPPMRLDTSRRKQLEDEVRQLSLPWIRAEELVRDFRVDETSARVVTQDRSLYEYFAEVMQPFRPIDAYEPRLAERFANWFVQEVIPLVRTEGFTRVRRTVTPDRFRNLIGHIEARNITREAGREILPLVVSDDKDPETIARSRNLWTTNAGGDLEGLADRVMSELPSAVADYKAGKTQAIGALLGKARELTGNTMDLHMFRGVLEERLNR